MAVVNTPQGCTLALKVANGASATGAAVYKTVNFSNLKPSATDQNLADLGLSLSGLLKNQLAGFTRIDHADLSIE